MAQPTYTTTAIVLQKTKLGESDLIYTLLDTYGRQLKAVGKGARKPTSPFASRMELFNTVELLCASGKNLDIVKEARLKTSRIQVSYDPLMATAASSISEIVRRLSPRGLEEARLFSLAEAALDALTPTDEPHTLAIVVAAIFKAVSICGFRPSTTHCAICGADSCNDATNTNPTRAFSYSEGGVICDQCIDRIETLPLHRDVIAWIDYVIHTPFSTIAQAPIDSSSALMCLSVAQGWCAVHLGTSLTSAHLLTEFTR